MKPKFTLTNIFFQVMIFILSGFIIMTQFGSMRQPVKLFVQFIFVLCVFSLIISISNYIREEKD
ncbi:hypothetical protein [Melissococcus plutonius]|uniref:hypothetical protein n=1 Tax=Melissococcus plutonius TaxID=33970 RepID=UPI00059DFAC3|nr:hypothetical protein [Melissococcus plutonius]AIM25464.1 hypothetical protein MEPL_c000800 [Melissococcus plutonius S1]KMT25738.1 hypothetical protein MEPL2_1c00810 [Melissococcus plutonius]KMT27083.1 hypothetical protein MEPL3_1c01080 [Melissococcus plutonius]KMT28184.1 hypothetical protein MEPL1_2c00110 [Melissococcus plutonius]KMT29921.1 hypothetical protein MEPL4_2c00270 [Melissococcus plutonius]